jgi:hypothetical protein
MKRILIVAGIAGILMPTLASAELNYNSVNVGFTTIMDDYFVANFTELSLGVSKSVSKRIYLGATYDSGSKFSTSTSSYKKVHSISLGAGFHTPLNDNTDIIVAGHIGQGTDKISGSTESANVYDIGAGVRAEFPYGLEASVVAVYDSRSNDTYSSKDTFVNAQFGFDFTPEIQMYGGFDLWRDNQTVDFGLRFFY